MSSSKPMAPWLKWLISIAHAFLLLLLSAFWMNSDYTYGDERMLIQWSSIFKRVVLNIDEDPPKDDYLFVNLAYEKALIPLEDGMGNEVITDRAQLARFFSILKRNRQPTRFVLCDVFLKGRSEYDSLLEASLSGLENVVFPIHRAEDGSMETLDLKVPHAIADYRMASGGFVKFRLVQSDTLKTAPVYMFERLGGHNIQSNNGIYRDNGKVSLNSVIIDYQIRGHELFEQGEYPVVNLSELLMLPEEVVVQDFLKNRVILMGDFNADVHETVFGSMPGTLILLNVYLTLKDGHHLITWYWLLFIIAGYAFFTRLMLFPEDDNARIRNIKWVGPLLGSAMYLSALSIISYLLFNIHIQVLVLTLYINLVRYVIRLRQSEKGWDQVKGWLTELRETYFNFG
jgi:hypothetical protein